MAKRKPYKPPLQGDIGPQTAAQSAGASIRVRREDNGTETRYKRRSHALEVMFAAGKISERQREAGLALFKAYCITQMTGDAPFTKVYVDVSPNPANVALMQTERAQKFTELSRHIPKALRGPVWHVAIHNKHLRRGYSRNGNDAQVHTSMLQVALDLVANHAPVEIA